ncbi:hypothetical protein V2J09_022629 [Rumex salicifolius]
MPPRAPTAISEPSPSSPAPPRTPRLPLHERNRHRAGLWEYATVAFREKMSSQATLRDVLLRARKVRAEEGVTMGFVDSAHGGTEAAVRKPKTFNS